jgi:hypothetical protein
MLEWHVLRETELRYLHNFLLRSRRSRDDAPLIANFVQILAEMLFVVDAHEVSSRFAGPHCPRSVVGEEHCSLFGLEAPGCSRNREEAHGQEGLLELDHLER